MSFFHCSISGEPLLHPVVNPKTGHVFEKSIIQSHINETGSCPFTNQSLHIDQLVPIKLSDSPKVQVQQSIPSLLETFQRQWENLTLENFQIKSHFDLLRKQLAHALYQNEAASRVIAKLLKEKQELVEALNYLKKD